MLSQSSIPKNEFVRIYVSGEHLMCVALLTRSAAKSFDLLAVKEAALLNVEGNRFILVQQYQYQDLQSILCSKEKQKLTGFLPPSLQF